MADLNLDLCLGLPPMPNSAPRKRVLGNDMLLVDAEVEGREACRDRAGFLVAFPCGCPGGEDVLSVEGERKRRKVETGVQEERKVGEVRSAFVEFLPPSRRSSVSEMPELVNSVSNLSGETLKEKVCEKNGGSFSLKGQLKKTEDNQTNSPGDISEYKAVDLSKLIERNRTMADREHSCGYILEDPEGQSSQANEHRAKVDTAPSIERFADKKCCSNGVVKDEGGCKNESQGVPEAPPSEPVFPPAPCSFFQTSFGFPTYLSGASSVPYSIPYFYPYVWPQAYAESSFTPFQLTPLPASGGSSFQMNAFQTPVLQPTPSHPPVPRLEKAKSFRNSRQKEKGMKEKESRDASFLSKELHRPGISFKPLLSRGVSAESKERSGLDQGESQVVSGTTSPPPEEADAAPPAPADSGNHSSSSGVYQSTGGETVESYPSKGPKDATDQSVQESIQRDASFAAKTACSQDFFSMVAPFVSTTANGNTTSGVLHRNSKGDVKICCECHGIYMNAREFVLHAGGVDGPHPERNILVNFFPVTQQPAAVQA